MAVYQPRHVLVSHKSIESFQEIDSRGRSTIGVQGDLHPSLPPSGVQHQGFIQALLLTPNVPESFATSLKAFAISAS
jgi:hypothetical protein